MNTAPEVLDKVDTQAKDTRKQWASQSSDVSVPWAAESGAYRGMLQTALYLMTSEQLKEFSYLCSLK
jgi:hypothetical protein